MEVQDIDRQIAELKKYRQAVETHNKIDRTRWTKKQLIEQAWKLPELPDSLIQLIIDNGGFKTGSTVYGDPNMADNVDYCVGLPPSMFEYYTIGRGDSRYCEADGFVLVHGHHNGRLVNILCFGDFRLLQAWRSATESMSILANSRVCNGVDVRKIFGTKWRRVRVFRALCDVFYTAYPLYALLSKEDAIMNDKCKLCGPEAIDFTDKAHKDEWKKTEVCERCSAI